MKRNHRLLVMLMAMMAMFSITSCNSLEDGSYVDPISLYERIGGRWVVNSVTQVDETNQTKLNLTEQFGFGEFAINLNVDQSNQPTGYTVEGSAPAFFQTSGNWKMGNAYINSDGSSAQIILNDKTPLTITALPGVQPTLEFKFTRSTKGQPFVSYVYNLTAAE